MSEERNEGRAKEEALGGEADSGGVNGGRPREGKQVLVESRRVTKFTVFFFFAVRQPSVHFLV